MKNVNVQSSKFKVIYFLLFTFYFLLGTANAQFTTGKDTLLVPSGDSITVCITREDVDDTTDGLDLDGWILTGIDFDTTSAWTSAKFSIQTSETYNEAADTAGGSPYDWKLVNYEGTVYTFTPEVGAVNILDRDKVYALKRYVRFICNTSGGGYENEAADRKMVPLIRRGF